MAGITIILAVDLVYSASTRALLAAAAMMAFQFLFESIAMVIAFLQLLRVWFLCPGLPLRALLTSFLPPSQNTLRPFLLDSSFWWILWKLSATLWAICQMLLSPVTAALCLIFMGLLVGLSPQGIRLADSLKARGQSLVLIRDNIAQRTMDRGLVTYSSRKRSSSLVVHYPLAACASLQIIWA